MVLLALSWAGWLVQELVRGLDGMSSGRCFGTRLPILGSRGLGIPILVMENLAAVKSVFMGRMVSQRSTLIGTPTMVLDSRMVITGTTVDAVLVFPCRRGHVGELLMDAQRHEQNYRCA